MGSYISAVKTGKMNTLDNMYFILNIYNDLERLNYSVTSDITEICFANH